MPKLNKVIAGLALSAALGGGALAMGATTASAATLPTGWGDTNLFDSGLNNTFENASFQNAPLLAGGFGSDCFNADLDDILWDIYVAGHHSGPAFSSHFN